MKNKGITFKIPNEYGSYLADLLDPINFTEYLWLIGSDEIYLIDNDEITDYPLYKEEDRIIPGKQLYDTAKKNTYYMIFITLRAVCKDGNIKAIRTYKEFLESDCQIALAVYDSIYVMVWFKSDKLLSDMYNYAQVMQYEDVRCISESDLLTKRYHIE